MITHEVKIKNLIKIKLLSHSGHLDEKNDVFEKHFPISYPSDMDELAMTCSDFVNVSRAKYGYTKKVVIDRWPTIETLSAEQFSANFDI